MELQKNLLALRHKMNLSQDALADKVGVSRQTVSRWEVGDVTPTADNLLALSTLYGVPAEELMDERIENILKKLEERKISAQKAEEDTPAEEAAQTEPPPPKDEKTPSRAKTALASRIIFISVVCIIIAMLIWGYVNHAMVAMGGLLILAGAISLLIFGVFVLCKIIKFLSKKG